MNMKLSPRKPDFCAFPCAVAHQECTGSKELCPAIPTGTSSMRECSQYRLFFCFSWTLACINSVFHPLIFCLSEARLPKIIFICQHILFPPPNKTSELAGGCSLSSVIMVCSVTGVRSQNNITERLAEKQISKNEQLRLGQRRRWGDNWPKESRVEQPLETVLQLFVGCGICAVTASEQKWLKLNVHKTPALTEIETLLILLIFFFTKHSWCQVNLINLQSPGMAKSIFKGMLQSSNQCNQSCQMCISQLEKGTV